MKNDVWRPLTISEIIARAKVTDWSKQPFCTTRYESIKEAYAVAASAGETLIRDDWPPLRAD